MIKPKYGGRNIMKQLFNFQTRKKVYDWYFKTRYSYSEFKHLDTIFPLRRKKYWFDPLPSSPANWLDNYFAKLIQ